jgi:hypothetical protein
MKIFLIIIMFLVSVYAINDIAERGRVVKVGSVIAQRTLPAAGCISIAIIAVACDLACLYLIVKVV